MIGKDDSTAKTFSHSTRAEGIRFLYRNLYALIPGLTLLPAILAWAVWEHVEHEIVLTWLAVALVNIFARLWLNYRFQQLQPDDDQVFNWGRYFTYTSILTGLVYGSSAFLFFIPDAIPLQLLVFTVIIGMASGATYVTSHWLESYYAMMIPALGLASFALVLQPDEGYRLLAFAIFVYLLMCIAMGKRSSESVLSTIQLRFENADLLHQLTLSKEKAEQANVRKTRFLASASHDLRQPVHVLNLFADALSRELLTQNGHRLLGSLKESINALSQLLSSLLDISKLDAGVVTPEMMPIHLPPLLTRLYRDYEPLTAEKGIKLKLKVNKTSSVYSDAILLENILRNLLSNAIKYTFQGSILLSCRQRANQVWLEIRDTGEGIEEKYQALIFEEFYQIHNEQRDRRQGLGLGLAIVKRQAELLNHELSMKSCSNKGSLFRLSIPITTAYVPDKMPHVLSINKLHCHGTHILVIDDDPLILEGTRIILENWHYTVSTVDDFKGAVNIIKTQSIDIIISDYSLGNVDGIKTVKELRTIAGKDIPAFLITGDTAPERIKTAKQSGMLLLHKPVNLAKLRVALQQNTYSR